MLSYTQHKDIQTYLMAVKRFFFLFLSLLIIIVGAPTSSVQARSQQIETLAYSDNMPVPPEVTCAGAGTTPGLSHVGTAVQQALADYYSDPSYAADTYYSSLTNCNELSGDWILDVPNVSSETQAIDGEQFYDMVGDLIENTKYTFSMSTLNFDTHAYTQIMPTEGNLEYNLLKRHLAPSIRTLHDNTPVEGPYPLLRFHYSDGTHPQIGGDTLRETYADLTANLPEDEESWKVSIAVGYVGQMANGADLYNCYVGSLTCELFETLTPWNHSKIAVRDYEEAIVGGMNWELNYVTYVDVGNGHEPTVDINGQTYNIHALHDLSLQVKGEAALAANVYFDKVWQRVIDPNDPLPPQYQDCVSSWQISSPIHDCALDEVPNYAPNNNQIPDYSVNNQANVFSLGRGFTGFDRFSAQDYSADEAVFAAFDIAQDSIYINQHQMSLFTLLSPEIYEKLIDAIVDPGRKVDVKIIISPPWGDSKTPLDVVYNLLVDGLYEQAQDEYTNAEDIDAALCRLQFGEFRVAPNATYDLYHTHNKFWMVDEAAFFVGSQNLYPSAIGTIPFNIQLNEYGFMIDDSALAAQMKAEYWEPLWEQTSIWTPLFQPQHLSPGYTCENGVPVSSQYSLVSVSSEEEQGNDDSGDNPYGGLSGSEISDDGRYVVFTSLANNLVISDTNGASDVFVRDLVLGTTERVSIASDGMQGNGESAADDISSDGRYVVFTSSATNLVDNDTNGVDDTFLHDRLTNNTTRVSVSSGGQQANGNSIAPVISGDGCFVAFISEASNLVSGDTNDAVDVFVHDTQLGTTERVSIGANGVEGNGNSPAFLLEGYAPAISSDGRYVAFMSAASNLVANDTNDVWDIFVYDRATDTTQRINVGPNGEEADSNSLHVDISGDGKSVVFTSDATNLAPLPEREAANGYYNVFVYDFEDNEIFVIDAEDPSLVPVNPTLRSYYPSISIDGRYVVYSSVVNISYNIFRYDRNTDETTALTQHDVTWSGSFDPSISGSGQAVVFSTSVDGLVASDSNNSKDVIAWMSQTVAKDDIATVFAGESVTINVLANDVSPDEFPLSVNSFTDPQNGDAVLNSDDSITYTPDFDFHGEDYFTYTVIDNDGNYYTAKVTVWVFENNDPPVNNPPTLQDDNTTTQEDTAVAINVLNNDSDPDGDSLVVDSITQPANGGAVLNADNTVTYTPDANFNGSDSFAYTASDGNGGSDNAIVTVTVQPVNDAPTANDDAVTLVNNLGEAIAVLANDTDIDGDNLSVIDVTQPANGVTLINQGTTVTYIPDNGFTGVDSFIYTISDLNGGTDTATVTVTVNGGGGSGDLPTPWLNTDIGAVGQAGTASYDNGVFTVNGGGRDGFHFVYQPLAGDGSITVQVTSQTTPDYWSKAGVMMRPDLDYDSPFVAAVVASRANRVDTLQRRRSRGATDQYWGGDGNLPIWLRLERVGSTVTSYRSDDGVNWTQLESLSTNMNGTIYVGMAVTSHTNDALSEAALANVVVSGGGSGGNQPPIAVNDTAMTVVNIAVDINVLANDTDPDGDTLSVVSFSQPSNGFVISDLNGPLTYMPRANFVGQDSFTYTVSDGKGGTDSATVTVTVNGRNDREHVSY